MRESFRSLRKFSMAFGVHALACPVNGGGLGQDTQSVDTKRCATVATLYHLSLLPCRTVSLRGFSKRGFAFNVRLRREAWGPIIAAGLVWWRCQKGEADQRCSLVYWARRCFR